MLSVISRWFERTAVSQEYRRGHLIALTAILAVGAVLRFWGLGNVGLHGDEETMAMPALAILETGHPILPSGMYYPRAPLQLYLMAGSAWLFGESEWAFRFPSAVVGSLAGLAAFWMGRRFLAPAYNLAFVATITFLPYMVEISQTARMYVFFIVAVMVYTALIFKWEGDQRLTSLLLALLVWVVALQFQSLAAFAAPLFLFPGLSRGSWRQLLQGAVAFGLAAWIWRLNWHWIGSHYPATIGQSMAQPEESTQRSLELLLSQSTWLVVILLIATVVFTIYLVAHKIRTDRLEALVPVSLVGAALIAFSLLHYHIGAILMLFGVIGWLRTGRPSPAWLTGLFALALAITVVQVTFLHATGLYPGRKIIGALTGDPSIWPVIRFLQLSPLAGMIYAFVLLKAGFWLAKGRAIPDHFLFFGMAVWAPLLVIGLFAWDVPPRYSAGHVPAFLLCLFAGLSFVMKRSDAPELSQVSVWRPTVVLIAAVVLAVNPFRLVEIVPPTYDSYPDHKGAAEFIAALPLSEPPLLIAEDVLQQSYYLGKVDYWLRQSDNALGYAVRESGRPVDFYTGTEVLGSGADLLRVLNQNPHRNVFVIGSGENFVGATRLFRGEGIAEVLESDRLEIVYRGRDSKTRVWKLVQ